MQDVDVDDDDDENGGTQQIEYDGEENKNRKL